ELRAAGNDVISFAAGEPDFDTPQVVVEAAARACRDPRMHHYTPAAGLPELREAVAFQTGRRDGLDVLPEQVLITNGTKQAVAHAFTLLLDPGDEVLVPSPYWVSFPETIALAGGRPVPIPTTEATGFRVTPDDLDRHLTPRTKALLFVSPSNPTGSVYRREQMLAIGRWAADHGVWVVCDEIYDHFTYDRAEFNSLPVVVPELQSRALRLNGVAKAYSMTGWRVGWLVGPRPMVEAAANLQSHVCGNISNISQLAALAALEKAAPAVEEMRAAFARRRMAMLEYMDRVPGFECPAPEGAFYLFPSVRGALGRAIGGQRVESSAELAAVLLEQARIAVVPGEAFGAPGHVRFSYALADQDLAEGMARLLRLLG
ncbi:MAG: pyridoxal phosphate-dependent aminotransferase, partial [Candidatus Dormibacteria bacterium]